MIEATLSLRAKSSCKACSPEMLKKWVISELFVVLNVDTIGVLTA
jgi:hypothetical protein